LQVFPRVRQRVFRSSEGDKNIIEIHIENRHNHCVEQQDKQERVTQDLFCGMFLLPKLMEMRFAAPTPTNILSKPVW